MQLFVEMAAFISRMHEHLDVAGWGAKFDPADGKLVRLHLSHCGFFFIVELCVFVVYLIVFVLTCPQAEVVQRVSAMVAHFQRFHGALAAVEEASAVSHQRQLQLVRLTQHAARIQL